ncbi:MAG: hypothetical protein ACREV1_09800 [Gammaproteobacteria bacterium]
MRGSIGRPHKLKEGTEIRKVRNIDIAPTVMKILNVEPAVTVDGKVIRKILKSQDRVS